jgi:5-methylcytosine-specific restriction endonuclease McrA
MSSKACSKCGQVKPLEEFVNDYRLKSGKGSKCKSCDISIRAEKKYHLNKVWTPEKIEARRKFSSEWSKKNREKKRAYFSKWQGQNKEKIREMGHHRRVKMREDRFKISNKELKRLYSQPCFLCGYKGKVTMDHIIPIALGGRHSIGNLMPLCQPCNSSKGKKLLVFIRYNSHIERG